MLSPSRHGGPHARVSSPLPGRSTLTTSAPRSPSVIVANGPGEHAREVGDEDAVSGPSRAGSATRHTRLVQPACARSSSPTCTSAPRAAPTCCAGPSCGSRCSRRSPASTGSCSSATRSSCARCRSAQVAELAAPFFADVGRALGPDGRAGARRRQPRPRARGRLDRRPPADRAVRLPRPRAAHRARRRRPARRDAGRARRARPRVGRLPRRLAARRRLRDPRPLLRPAHHRADLRAPGDGRDGALGREPARRPARRPTTTRPCSRRCTRGCTRSRSAPTTRA